MSALTTDEVILAADLDGLSLTPLDIRGEFTEADDTVYLWVNFTDSSGGEELVFIWKRPDGSTYNIDYQFVVPAFPGSSVKDNIVWSEIDIQGVVAEGNTGEWSCEVYSGNILLVDVSFTVEETQEDSIEYIFKMIYVGNPQLVIAGSSISVEIVTNYLLPENTVVLPTIYEADSRVVVAQTSRRLSGSGTSRFYLGFDVPDVEGSYHYQAVANYELEGFSIVDDVGGIFDFSIVVISNTDIIIPSRISVDEIVELPPSYAADILDIIETTDATTIISNILAADDVREAVKIISEMEDETVLMIIDELSAEETFDIVANIEVSDGAAILDHLDSSRGAAIIEELAIDHVLELMAVTDPEQFTNIILDVEHETAIMILDDMDSEIIAEAFDTATAVETTRLADVLNEVDSEKAGEILLDVETGQGASLVRKMASRDIQAAAVRLEDAVKLRFSTRDPVEREEYVARAKEIADTLAEGGSVAVQSLVDLFVAIANLEDTPSTVATLLETMEMDNVFIVIKEWIDSGELEELALVFSHFSSEFYGVVYNGLGSLDKMILENYLDPDDIGSIPDENGGTEVPDDNGGTAPDTPDSDGSTKPDDQEPKPKSRFAEVLDNLLDSENSGIRLVFFLDAVVALMAVYAIVSVFWVRNP